MAAGLLIFPGANPSLGLDGERVAATLQFFVNQTTTPKADYAGSSLTTPLAQPIHSDAYGIFPMIWADSAEVYTALWTTADGQTKTIDDFSASTPANAAIYAATVAKYNDTVTVYNNAVALYGSLQAVSDAVAASQAAKVAAQQAVVDAQAQVVLAANQVAAAANQVALATTQAGNSAASAAASAASATAATGSASAAAGSATAAAASVSQAKAASTSVLLTFSTTTADADPGNGNVRLNNTDPTLATYIYVDNLDQAGNDMQVFWDSLDDSTSTVRGQIYFKEGASAKLAVYVVTGAVINGTGYRKIPVAYVAGTGTAFTNTATIGFNFSRTGDAAANASMGYTAKTAAYTVTAADWGKIIDCTGTFALTFPSAATLGAGFYCWVRSQSGTITGPTADGSTLILGPGDWALIEGDGSAFHAVVDRYPGWILDSSTAVTGSPTVISLALPTSGYSDLKIEVDGLVPSASLALTIAASTNGGSSYGGAQQLGVAGSIFTAVIMLIGYRQELTLVSGSYSNAAISSANANGSAVNFELRSTGGMTNLQLGLSAAGNFTNAGNIRVYKRR